MQRGSGNSDLPTGNYVSGGSLGQSDLIPINVTPSHGTHTPHVQGSEQRTSQPINLSLPPQVTLNLENGADRPSLSLASSSSPSVGSIIGPNASYPAVSDGNGQDLRSTSAGNNSMQNQLCSCGRIRNVHEEASGSVLHSENARYSNQIENCICREIPGIGSSSRSLGLPQSVIPVANTAFPNEATSYLSPLGTMAYAAHSSGIIYIGAIPDFIVMLPNVLGNYYFSDGGPTIVSANGTSIYHSSFIPRNPFSYWIPAGMITYTLAPVIPVMHAPSFSVPWPHFPWNWTYSSISVQVPSMYPVNGTIGNVVIPYHWTYSSISFQVPSMYPVNGTIGNAVIPYHSSLPFVPTNQFPHISLVVGADTIITSENLVNTNFAVQQASFFMNHIPIFAGVNHGPGFMPLLPYNFHMAQNAIPQTINVNVDNMSYEALLAFQAQVGHVSTGLSQEVIDARMKCIKYGSTERSENDNNYCCICLENFSDGELIGITECRHSYHFNCIREWLMEKNTCPLCKRVALAI